MSDENEKRLTLKQRRFIDEYLRSGNAAQSAISAGYSKKTAYSIGWENLRKPDISAEITRRYAEIGLNKEGTLLRLSDIATGDVTDLLDITSVGWNVDLLETDPETGERRPKKQTKLIRKLKQKVTTINGKDGNDTEIVETEIELYSALEALDKIGHYHKLFTNTVALQNPDGTALTPLVQIYLPDNKRNDNT